MARLETLILRDDAPQRSWLDRFGDAWRSLWLGPYNTKDPTLARLFGSAPVYSGVQINEEAAFAVSAFASGVFLIAWDIASLPLFHYKKLPNGGKARSDSRLKYLLHDQPNPDTTGFDFRSALLINALSTGNAYAEIERDAVGRPAALWHLDPSRVSLFYERGRRRYRIAQPASGGEIILPPQDMLHVKGPSYDAMVGFNTVRLAREALGLSIAAERFGATFFGNGSQLGGILTTDNMTPQARENLRNAFQARHQGSANAHKWLHVESNSTFTEIGTKPRDSQFVELRTFQLREIARFFRIPVSLLGDLERSTFANQEQELLKYFKSCLRPWLVNIEQELRSKLISPSERNLHTIEHVVEGFLRADTEQRSEFYSSMLDRGVLTINEVRALENLPAIPGGDTARVPMNTEALSAGESDTHNEDYDDVIEPQGRTAVVLAAHRDLLVEVFGRIIRRQTDKARKSQSTPQKLRQFVDYYYDDIVQIDICTQMLIPALRAWLAYIESETDVAVAADALARQHFADAKRQLLQVADITDNSELFQLSLQKLLLQWDTDRATHTVDAILRHGITKDGKLAVVATPVLTRSTPRGMSIAWLKRWHKTKLAMQSK